MFNFIFSMHCYARIHPDSGSSGRETVIELKKAFDKVCEDLGIKFERKFSTCTADEIGIRLTQSTTTVDKPKQQNLVAATGSRSNGDGEETSSDVKPTGRLGKLFKKLGFKKLGSSRAALEPGKVLRQPFSRSYQDDRDEARAECARMTGWE